MNKDNNSHYQWNSAWEIYYYQIQDQQQRFHL